MESCLYSGSARLASSTARKVQVQRLERVESNQSQATTATTENRQRNGGRNSGAEKLWLRWLSRRTVEPCQAMSWTLNGSEVRALLGETETQVGPPSDLFCPQVVNLWQVSGFVTACILGVVQSITEALML